MRHNKKVTHLGRTTSHKKALMKNLAAQVFEHKEIRTTEAKAKELRRVVDRLITYGKKGSVHHRRLAFRFLQNKAAVTRLFDEIAPTFEEREGGYTRIIKLGFRKGDAAPITVLQLVGFEAAAQKKKKKTEKKEASDKKAGKETKQEAGQPAEPQETPASAEQEPAGKEEKKTDS